MDVLEQYNSLPQESQIDILTNIRQSINQEIYGYEDGIQQANQRYTNHIDELKKNGRELDIPSVKKAHQKTVEDIRRELNESIEFRNKFAAGSAGYLKEAGKEGLLIEHGAKYFPDEKRSSTRTSEPASDRTKLSSQEIEQYNMIKSNLDQLSPEQREQFQALEQRMEQLQSRTTNAEKLMDDIKNNPEENRSFTTNIKGNTYYGPQSEKAEAKRAAAKEKLNEAAQGHSSTSPPIQLSYKEDPLDKNLGNIKGHPAPIKTNEQIKNYIQKNRLRGAGIGLGVGVVKSIFDEEDDDVFTATGKAVKSGAAVLGASYLAEIGLDYASNSDYQVAKMWTPTTVQDFEKGEVVGQAKKIKMAADTERKMVTVGGKLGTIAKVGAGIAGVASIMDIGQKVADNREAKRMKHEQEKNLIQKERKRKDKNKEQSYGYIQDGEILFDLFGDRTGHHKMGNAKFM